YAGGWIGDYFLRVSRQAYLWVSGGVTLVAAPLTLVALAAPQPAVYWTAIVAAELCLFASTGPINSVIVNVVAPHMRATAVALSISFGRIEVSGADRVPRHGAVIFVVNHPNGLIDPAFLLCLAPRRVSLLAKAPLFRMPVIGFFCRAFQTIPVHRRQDASSDPSQNRETFDTARAVLARGGAIAIFPEGTSHSDPKLRPLKTGAARIAFGAAAALAGSSPIRIVPAGLYYRAKRTFRSAALLYFGEPVAVDAVALAPGEEPPAGPVRALTARIRQARTAVRLQAEQAEAHA